MFCCLRNHKCRACKEGTPHSTRQVCRGDGFAYIIVGKSASSSIIGAIGNKYRFIPFEELCEEQGFVFSFVRNPIDRLFSCWNGWASRPGNPLTRCDSRLFAGISFPEFVDVVCDIDDDLADEHFVSQTTLLSRADGTLIPEFIGRVESINQDWKTVMKRTGLNMIGHQGHHPGRMSFEHVFTDELKQKIKHRYRADFECWYPSELKGD